MSSNDHRTAIDRTANHSVRSWLRSLLRRPSDHHADLEEAGPSPNSTTPPAGADMISFHHTMEDIDRPSFAPPPRSFSGGSSNGPLSYEAAARRTIAQPIATPLVGASHPPPSLSPHASLATPPSPSASPPKSPGFGRTLSSSVNSFTDRLHHQRRASETYRRMKSGSTSTAADPQLGGLSRSVSKTSDAQAPLVASPPALSEGEAQPVLSSARLSPDSQSSSINNDRRRLSAASDSKQSEVSTSSVRRPEPNSAHSTSSTSLPSVTSPNGATATENEAASELLLPEGEQMLKVTHKKVKPRTFKLDADRGQILWESKKNNRVNLESIREVRFGPSAASYRTSLNISSAHEPRWITIIYQNGGIYKALHLIALSDPSLSRWRASLLHLQTLRRELTGAAGASSSIEHRRHLWMRHHWKDADESNDEKLSIEEVMLLCRRLGIESNKVHLRRCFNLADWRNRGYLDFQDFQHFVSLLKQRADVQAIFAAWADQPAEEQRGCDL
ncbi:hypothetical protein EX895_005634 [Sporisorium graminicola]|uniref:phosphoinositide phospholipase C n=1 Tax=Sporisorium graminicola TaxID=280036 RepID=A0A4U7KR58_9BASI|nr:hypothetical protein EX895_005634 [Sporisorium graminicola]TKY85472.1 hypothetical protein EX895_005634 [Sporisorium graminicola]